MGWRSVGRFAHAGQIPLPILLDVDDGVAGAIRHTAVGGDHVAGFHQHDITLAQIGCRRARKRKRPAVPASFASVRSDYCWRLIAWYGGCGRSSISRFLLAANGPLPSDVAVVVLTQPKPTALTELPEPGRSAHGGSNASPVSIMLLPFES